MNKNIFKSDINTDTVSTKKSGISIISTLNTKDTIIPPINRQYSENVSGDVFIENTTFNIKNSKAMPDAHPKIYEITAPK